jgi:hypothetical protein
LGGQVTGHDDVFLDPVEPRLRAAFALRLAVPGAAPSEAAGLIAFARALGEQFAAVAAAEGWSVEPPFPGATPGLERIDGVLRLAFAARISEVEGGPLGVAFTTIIAGRRPEIGVAPPETPLPTNWSAL